MHRALCVEEILLNIFHHCDSGSASLSPVEPHSLYANAHLTALARTCRAFKEPALDVIWAELDDLSPLLWPWLAHRQAVPHVDGFPRCSLKKHPQEADWNIILGYARRVYALPRLDGSFGLDQDSILVLSNPPASSGPIFPNLRTLTLDEPFAMVSPLIQHLVRPTVTNVSFCGMDIFESAINGFGEGCPFVTDLRLMGWDHETTIGLIRHWKNLCAARCYEVDLKIDALSNFAHLRNLHVLSFMVNPDLLDQIQASVLAFSALRELDLNSPHLATVVGLLRHFHLPVLHKLSVDLSARPTPPTLVSLFVALQQACTHTSLNNVDLCVLDDYLGTLGMADAPPEETCPPYHITFDHLQSLTPFENIKSVLVRIPCGVDLSEDQLLTLASSWPHLEEFEVGTVFDWTPSSKITPDGFIRLLERCRSLRVLCYKLDTSGYVQVPQGDPWRGLRMPTHASIDLINSPIEEESVEALAVFFHVGPYPSFGLYDHWEDLYEAESDIYPRELCRVSHDRWTRVRVRARELWAKRRALRYSLEAPSWWQCPQ